ncbi:MAG: helix-turn-helix domain-containing protein [Phycisphaerae bacterium]|nr:helix-turn-helix domain-containing protein [Phycisphaerae bacterium]
MPTKPKISNKLDLKISLGRPALVLDAGYFYFDTEPFENQPLAIVCGGHEKCSPTFTLNRNSYPYFVIKYTISGQGIFKWNSDYHQLTSGCLTSFSPDTPHQYFANPDDPMEHIFITFIGTEAKRLLDLTPLGATGFMQVPNPGAMLNYMQTIFDKGCEKRPYHQAICCNYLRIALLELAGSSTELPSNSSAAMQTYQRCRKYIDQNFSELYAVTQVAKACFIDVRYMARLFRQLGAMTPYQYLMRLKLNKAANLLLHTSMSVNEVGKAVGFEDQYHFSRNFKKMHSLSPRNFRNQHIGQDQQIDS